MGACQTPLMAFHSDFWVAIAASAPVIALAAVLPLASSRRSRSAGLSGLVSKLFSVGTVTAKGVKLHTVPMSTQRADYT